MGKPSIRPLTPEELVRGAIYFCPERVDGAHDNRPIGQMSRWLLGRPREWRISVAQKALLQAESEAITLLTGEEGAGKTTAMVEALQTMAQDPTNLVVYLEFSRGDALFELNSARERIEWTCRNIRSKIEMALDGESGDLKRYNGEMLRHLALTHQHPIIRELRDREGSRIRAMPAEAVVDDRATTLAIRVARAELDDGAALVSLQRATEKRLILALDNPDHWGVETVADIFRYVTTQLASDTVLIAAIRPQFATVATDYRATPKMRTVNLHDYHSVDLMVRICKRRVRAAVRYARSEQPALAARLEEIRKSYRDSFSAMLCDDDMYNLACRWMNFNYRQMSDFFAKLERAPLVRRGPKWRSFVLRSLVKDSLTHEQFSVLSPDSRHSALYPSLPFVFLKLRILSYLRRNGGTGIVHPIQELRRVFSDAFGIAGSDIDEATRGLSMKMPSGGRMVRVVHSSPDTGAPRQIVLMPAGELMASTLVFSVDMLSWTYLALGNRPRLVGPEYSPSVKLANAMALIEGTLLPALLREHPYMAVGRNATEEERVRLERYARLFGFGPEKWYIQELGASLIRYCSGRGRGKLRVMVDPLIEQIEECVFQLNRAYPMQSAESPRILTAR